MGDSKLATLFTTAANTSVLLHPEWTFAAEQKLIAHSSRTLAGLLFTYRWGTFSAYRIPLRFVSDSDRSILHQWWREGERLLFTLNTSQDNTNTVCRIVNRQAPLTQRVRANRNLWAGLLELEAVDARNKLGHPFVLDDPVWGRLDQTNISVI